MNAGGVTSAIDLGLHLCERLAGPQARARVAAQMNYPYFDPRIVERAGGH